MPQPSRRSQLLAGTVGVAMLVAAGLAEVHAQEQQPAMPAELTQSQIETFADAAIEVRRVEQDFHAQVQSAADAQEIERLQQQAQQDAREAIENHGLSVDEYSAIAQAANQDPRLYAMIVETMQQRAR